MKKIALSLFLVSNLFSFDQNDFMNQASNYFDIAKETTIKYSKKARDITVENSILAYLRLKIDKNKLKVIKVTLYEEYKLKIIFSLPDYSKNIIVTVKNFDWSKSIDNNYIVFNNIEYSSNIPDLDFIINKYLHINNGYILMKDDITTTVLLSSIKKSSEQSYNSDLYNRDAKIDTKKILDILYGK